jgi:putative transposase
MSNPFRYFNSSPEVIRLVVMMYVRYPLSLRNVEDLLAERGIDISHETVRFWWNRFGPMFAAEIRKRRVAHMRGYPQWRWHLDEVFVKINGKLYYLGAPSTMKAKSWRRWSPRGATRLRR